MRSSILICLVVAAAALLADGPKSSPSPLPKDTLPESLSITEIPLGLERREVPANSALTDARVRLGRRLFFDPILSGDNTVACASCHHPEHGFASIEAKPRGIGGQEIARRAPTLFNRAYGKAFFWDGRAATLEEQALLPIENPHELGSKVPDVLKKLQANESYKTQFAAAFDDGVTAANLAKAIAAFERVILRGNSRVDLFRQKGEHKALNPSERAGLWIYESKGQCWRCHGGANFTDDSFHNTGVAWGNADLGRFDVTKKEEDRGKFKTPTLRGASMTAPYMHDGSLKTLEEVIDFYNKGGIKNPKIDGAIAPLNLNKEEMRDLAAFLRAL